MIILTNNKIIKKVDELSKLEHHFKFKNDKAIFILNQLLCGINSDDEFKETGWVSLCSSILNKTIGKYHHNYLDLFVKQKLILKKNYHKQNHRCNKYFLIEDYQDSDEDLLEYEITDWTLRKKNMLRIMPSVKKRYNNLWKWFDSPLFTIDRDSALKELKNLDISKRRLRFNLNSICNFQYGRKWFVRHNKDKRLHTNLTNMKSEIRKHLRYDKKKLVNIDIKNSQIFFLLVVLDRIRNKNILGLEKYSNIILPLFTKTLDIIEFERFKKLVISGTFYNELGRKLIIEKGKNGVYEKMKYDYINEIAHYYEFDSPKALMKPITFEILFSKNECNSTEKSWFKKEFPTIMEVIKTLKEKKHNELAILLQNIEAEVILDNVIKSISKFNKDIPLFTIHDSIMTSEEHSQIVFDIMKREINRITRFEPSISID